MNLIVTEFRRILKKELGKEL